MATAKKTKTTTKTKTVNFLDEFIGLIDSIILDTFNRDNLNGAIKKIKKISISSENEQEQINVLFGDIYLITT